MHKFLSSLFVFFCFIGSLTATSEHFEEKVTACKNFSNCHKERKHSRKKCKKPKKNLICAKEIGAKGFVITTPGVWFLSEDVNYNPRGQNPAITIAANNVTLNLDGHILSQMNKNVTGIAGIVINPGLSNITLKNGTVRDFSALGIQAGALPPAAVLSEFSILDIHALNNGNQELAASIQGGIALINTQDVILENSTMNENVLVGLYVNVTTKFTMNNSHCDDNTWGLKPITNPNVPFSNFAMGALFDNTVTATTTGPIEFITMTNCTFNNNFSIVQATGVELNAGNNVFIDSCQFNGNTTTANSPQVLMTQAPNGNSPFVYGLQVILPSSNIKITNCQCNNNSVIVNPPSDGSSFVNMNIFGEGIIAAGLITGQGIQGQQVGLSIDNCQCDGTSITINTPINNNPATPGFDLIHALNAFGMRIAATAKNVSITNTSASGSNFNNNTTAGVSASAHGYSIGGALHVFMNNCQSNGNFTTFTTTPTTAIPSVLVVDGFSISIDAELENCFSNGHTQAVPNVGGTLSTCAGFIINPGNNIPIVLRNCVATNNVDTFAGTAGSGSLAAGFLSRTTSNGPYLFENCIAELNTSNGSDAAGTAGCGFYLSGPSNSKIIYSKAEKNNIGILVTGASTENVIESNILSSNTLFGIRDETNTNTNSYFSNRAKNNGATPASTNYSSVNGILPPATCPPTAGTPGTPIRFWQSPSAPCPVNNNGILDELDNISIVN